MVADRRDRVPGDRVGDKLSAEPAKSASLRAPVAVSALDSGGYFATEPKAKIATDKPDLPHVAVEKSDEKLPRVATVTDTEIATRGKSAKTNKPAKPAKSTSSTATRGKSAKPPVVEDVKASKGTWAFRLRWNSLPDRPVEYVRRVTDSVHTLIREENYEEFKEQLIRNYKGQGSL